MELFKIAFDKCMNLEVTIHWGLYSTVLIFLLFWIYRLFKGNLLYKRNIEIEKIELGTQGQKVIIKPNYINIEIAYKIWVELNTRKIGLKIDFEHDVISEVYDSWYKFFSINRELLKSLPANKIRNDKSTRNLIDVSTAILNEGLRPHLTLWQAKFRRYYDKALKEDSNKEKSPQQIQQEFPKYSELKSDMEQINVKLINYKKSIEELAFGKQ